MCTDRFDKLLQRYNELFERQKKLVETNEKLKTTVFHQKNIIESFQKELIELRKLQKEHKEVDQLLSIYENRFGRLFTK